MLLIDVLELSVFFKWLLRKKAGRLEQGLALSYFLQSFDAGIVESRYV